MQLNEAQRILNEVRQGWTVTEQLGKGGFGSVFKIICHNAAGTLSSAMKIIEISSVLLPNMNRLSPSEIEEAYNEYEKRFINEINLMKAVQGHDNIVSIEDFKTIHQVYPKIWYIVIFMELLTPLKNVIFESEDEVIRLGIDICTALEIISRKGIVHRDIKPENIFRNDYGNYKLGDFGVAKILEKDSNLTYVGASNYMAPEMAKFKVTQTNFAAASKMDIYSLGIVLYELCNDSKLPFYPIDKTVPTPEEMNTAYSRRIMKGEPLPPPQNASKELQGIILKACAYKPENRYDSASEMKFDLERIKEKKLAPPPPPPPPPPPTPPEGPNNNTEIIRDPIDGENPKKPRQVKKAIEITLIALLSLLLLFTIARILIDKGKNDEKETIETIIPKTISKVTVRQLDSKTCEIINEWNVNVAVGTNAITVDKTINGYNLIGPNEKTVNVSDDGTPDISVVDFSYQKLSDYYTEQPIIISPVTDGDGMNGINDSSIIIVSPITPTVTVRLLDYETCEIINQWNENVNVGINTISVKKEISGYKLIGPNEKTVNVGEDGTPDTLVVDFSYRKLSEYYTDQPIVELTPSPAANNNTKDIKNAVGVEDSSVESSTKTSNNNTSDEPIFGVYVAEKETDSSRIRVMINTKNSEIIGCKIASEPKTEGSDFLTDEIMENWAKAIIGAQGTDTDAITSSTLKFSAVAVTEAVNDIKQQINKETR